MVLLCIPGFTQVFWLDETELSLMETGWSISRSKLSSDGNPLSVGGVKYERGVGTHAISKFFLDLHGTAISFSGAAGVDDESGEQASIEFFIIGDKKILWQSGVMKKNDAARPFDLDLSGIQKLALYVSDGGDYIHYDHADWLDAKIEYTGERPEVILPVKQKPYILTPREKEVPQINGAMVFGATPGRSFHYKIPVTGIRPMVISAEGLPIGLELDPVTGIITGITPSEGEYIALITAKNDLGTAIRPLKIVAGQGLALTPPMGWNSWNCWGLSVSDEKVRASANAMVEKGLVEHGWMYMNIDDGWEAETRTPSGELLANEKFPDMKALSDYLHNNGLKLGIYSSPGPKTCGGYLGSWEHEWSDAKSWANWGIDYLKYDWCSYGKIAADDSRDELQKPYLLMRKMLDQTNRDIVYSLCQYGMGNVWEWGKEVGGNLWRTTGDITDTWSSMAGIGFSQDVCSPYANPGHWNDPDMLVLGKVGWGPNLHDTKLTPDEQYTHISLWSLLAAPLLIGCDLAQLDDFTISLLTNDEVIAVNQDPLGKQAYRFKADSSSQVWVKPLEDGSLAIGLFYTGSESPVETFLWDGVQHKREIAISLEELGLKGPQKIRDLWKQQELGIFNNDFSAEVNYHGTVLIRVSSE